MRRSRVRAESPSAPAPEAEPDSPSQPDDMGSFGEESLGGSRRGDEDRDDFMQIAAAEPTLQEALIRQLQLTSMSERDKRVALLVIAHHDGDGYLTAGLEELHAIGAAEIADLEAEEISIALRQVQHLEPAGVGARDLGECLALQLKALDPATPHRDCALELVSRHLDVLAARDFNKLRRLRGVSEDELREVRALILTLDPKPVFGTSR